MNELVSIITPVYNCQDYIEQAIWSVRNQTYPHWEHIIVDDASTDKTTEIVQKYAEEDSRIRFVKLKENGGVANARNTALALATGTYIAFLDGDDQWKPQKLEQHMRFMLENKIDFSYTPYDVIDETGNYLRRINPKRSQVTYRQLLLTNIMACCTIIVKSTLVKDEQMPDIGHEDYAMWLNILRHNDAVAVRFDECLSVYRKAPGSVSANKWKTICWNYKTYRYNQKLGRIQSVYYLINFMIRTSLKYLKGNHFKICQINNKIHQKHSG